jgi:ankyrin repeat protein
LQRAADRAGAQNNYTPLHVVAECGIKGAVQRLLDAGADMGAAIDGGSAPLHLAAFAGYDEVAALLLDRGAVASQKVRQGGPAPCAAAADSRDGTERRWTRAAAPRRICRPRGRRGAVAGPRREHRGG